MKWLELNLLSLCKMQHGNLVLLLRVTYCLILSGYHADTPITIKAEAIHEADSRSH